MNVLGLNNFANHDPSASIVTDKNGKVEYVHISEERLSRVKRSHFSPIRSIKYCMDHFGIKDLGEIDLVVMDYIFDKQITDTARHYRKLEYDYLKTKLKLDFSKVIYVESHHMAHATTAFYPSGFDEAAILVVDGFGSNVETNSIYVGDKKGIRLIDKAYGQGIGLVYEVVTSDILGFKRGQEGKTMGLAAFGRNIKGKNILNLNPIYDGIITDYSDFIDRAPRERLKQKLPKCPHVKEECVTLLCHGYSTKEMKEYLKSQFTTHDYYNNHHTFITLKSVLHQTLDAYKLFITDQYHFDLIQRFMTEEFYLVNKHKIVIIEGSLRNLPKVKSDSFALLFNVSLYINDKTVFNFYKDRSMLRLRAPYDLNEKPENQFNQSNEYNLSKDWDRFYQEHILS